MYIYIYIPYILMSFSFFSPPAAAPRSTSTPLRPGSNAPAAPSTPFATAPGQRNACFFFEKMTGFPNMARVDFG